LTWRKENKCKEWLLCLWESFYECKYWKLFASRLGALWIVIKALFYQTGSNLAGINDWYLEFMTLFQLRNFHYDQLIKSETISLPYNDRSASGTPYYLLIFFSVSNVNINSEVITMLRGTLLFQLKYCYFIGTHRKHIHAFVWIWSIYVHYRNIYTYVVNQHMHTGYICFSTY
jgi:hypothetical protein